MAELLELKNGLQWIFPVGERNESCLLQDLLGDI